MKEISAFVAGLLFSLGLIISGMTNPENIISFLDVTGNWNPALMFVLMSAVVVTGIGYRLVWKRSKPVYEISFSVPTSRVLDKRLIGGSAAFGVGWGLVGLCPGPALASVFTSNWMAMLIFLAAMSGGVLLQRGLSALAERKRPELTKT
jgi:uncharacterized membrane protein YedE/YeeE